MKPRKSMRMRYEKIKKTGSSLPGLYLYLAVILLLSGCINSKEKRQYASIMADTVVRSVPVNCVASLDTVEASRKVEIGSYKDMLSIFDGLNYTPEAWQEGIREVPRVYLTVIGDRWGSTSANEMTVDNKKRIFFRGIAPLVLHANELILRDRAHLEFMRDILQQKDTLVGKDHKWVLKLANAYKVEIGKDGITVALLDELLARVDIIPPSLALAQGAEESGWGTSRFAATGNAIYGQWSWGENAMVPERQREGMGNYGIAAFGSLQESVSAYMLNLNSHNAYAALREKRASLRNSGKMITGNVLAGELTRYSERGEDYVITLKKMMEVNMLGPADEAFLADAPPIYLLPKKE